MIRIKNVTVIKSGQKLLQDFNLDIRNSEHYLLGGSNGSGKTTLLELIAGHVHPSKGTITYDFITSDQWEDHYWERRRKIHFIPTHAIHQFVKNSSGLYYQQRYYGGDENNASKTVREVLGTDSEQILRTLRIPETLNVHALLDIDISRLSNGQLKKVLLLQSLLKEKPRMLLLDYPFEGLDPSSRKDLSTFIDFIATTYAIQIILVDHHHHLPSVITHSIELNNFTISKHFKAIPVSSDIIETPQHILNDNKFSQSPVVEMRNVKIQYGNAVILKDFDWTVKKGERWALTGRNGSGKTTIFSLIFADHPMAYSEQVYLFGKRRGTGESIWDIKKRITYVGPELINYLNAKSILSSAREYITRSNRSINEDRLNELIIFFEAIDFIDKPVKNLSSGELQLTFIISSFLEDRELLLLDEPFQFLDGRKKLLLTTYLQKHLSSDTTLILITHYDADIANWTNRVRNV